MAYSIREGVEDREKQLQAERAIAERFPDATLWDRVRGEAVWASESAIPHVTDIDLVPDDKGNIHVYTYLMVEPGCGFTPVASGRTRPSCGSAS
jgi:hypothetical protein